ncbi:MAG: cytochrome c3 family protein [Anaerolineae bacterium]
MKRNLFALLLIAGLLFAACAGPPDANDVIPHDVVDPTTEQEEEADVEEEPMEEDETEAGDEGMVPAEVSELTIPFRDLWAESPHNAAEDASFTHWNEDDPAEIPQSCAACHSTPGHLDYLGADGTAANSVEEAVAIGTTITCEACHNEVTWDMDTVLFPSGVELTDLGSEANCMTCHQGRSSTNTVVDAIEEVGLTDDPDTPSEDLGFVNIHYYAAAATMYGSEVHGGFEYEGNRYVGKFEHVADFDTCTSCHNAHTLEVDPEPCAACHDGVSTVEDLNNIRTAGSLIDYDGDGSIDESISGEIEGLQEMLFQAIQTYADEVIGTPIVYSSESYPYFFIDSNADGELQDDEASFPNQYNAYSPRLLKAAYNYQVSQKDPGAFAHGAKYVIQLLYDSTADLNEAIGDPVDLSAANRNDPGHFSATEQAFRTGMKMVSCRLTAAGATPLVVLKSSCRTASRSACRPATH